MGTLYGTSKSIFPVTKASAGYHVCDYSCGPLREGYFPIGHAIGTINFKRSVLTMQSPRPRDIQQSDYATRPYMAWRELHLLVWYFFSGPFIMRPTTPIRNLAVQRVVSIGKYCILTEAVRSPGFLDQGQWRHQPLRGRQLFLNPPPPHTHTHTRNMNLMAKACPLLFYNVLCIISSTYYRETEIKVCSHWTKQMTRASNFKLIWTQQTSLVTWRTGW